MKKKGLTKRILAVALSLVIALGLLPVMALADNTTCNNGNHKFDELGKCGCGVQAEASVTQISLETDYEPVFYLKLADAVTACNNSEMGSMRLKLLDDVTVSVPSGDDACITLTKYTSLDLNGHSITTYDDVLCVILFCHNGMIWDTSADKTGRISGGTYAFKTDGGWVYIRGGTFESWISTAGGGKTYIDGGTYNGEIFFANSKCEFELNAGTFTKGILINGSCGTRNIFNLLGEGKAYQVNGRLYDSADAENWQTPKEFFKYNEVKVVTTADVAVAEVDGIKYTSLSAAIAAADRDTTITLLKDTDEDITVSKDVNIDFGGKKASGVYTFDGGSITVIGAFESGTKLKVKKNSYTTEVEWATVVIWDQSDFLTNDDIQPVDAGAEIKSYGKSHALVHSHGWDHKVSDTQDGKLIEIYCKYLDTCPNADDSDALGAWLELCSDELTYNGWTREARLSHHINTQLYTDTLPDSSDIVYRDEKGNALVGKPKNAGNYTASLTFVNADGTDVVVTVDFTILPKKLTADMITVIPSEKEYNGDPVSPVVTVKDGDTTLNVGTDYKVEGDISGTDVSTYKITVLGLGNYCDSATVEWDITKTDISKASLSAEDVEVTYDGSARTFEVKGAPEGAEITYSTDGGSTYVTEKPTFTNVSDSGTVYYKITHKNYNEYNGSATVTVNPKEISFDWGVTDRLSYTGETVLPEAIATNLIGEDTCELTVSVVETTEGSGIQPGKWTARVTDLSNKNYTLPTSIPDTEYTIYGVLTAPEVIGEDETVYGKEDGKITGLTTDMEYAAKKDASDDEYTRITDADMTFVSGTYYVRYAAKDYYYSSDATVVVINSGRKLKVTLPSEQIGYTLKAEDTELEWNGSTALAFELADGYFKTDSFAVNINGNPIELTDNKYTITNAQSDIVITVQGVEEIIAPKTNDNGNIILWLTVFFISGLSVCLVGRKKYRIR